MIKLIFVIILLIHGLIHLLGFIYEWKLAAIKQFTGKTMFRAGPGLKKILGIVWLVILVLFIFTALLYIINNEYWWALSIVSVILSQLLIIFYWKDAKAGTILNIIILLVSLVGYGNWKLDELVKGETRDIFARNPANERIILIPENYRKLPEPVQRWLMKSGVTGKEMTRTVRLKQQGEMCSKKGGKWMSFRAEQYYTVQRPAFVWKALIDVAPGIFMSGRDLYNKGHGNMKIMAMSLYTVADSRGPEMDQGTLLRYLAEMTWFPSAALSPYVSWSPVDSVSARAIMSYRNVTASGVFTFTPEGDMISFEALRYGEFDGTMSQQRWHIDCSKPREFQGIRIPSVSVVTWKLKDSDWTWLKLELTDVEYNKPEIYP